MATVELTNDDSRIVVNGTTNTVAEYNEKLSIRINNGSRRGYIYLVYIQADGTAVSIPTGFEEEPADPRTSVTYGTGSTAITVEPPYGYESAVLIISKKQIRSLSHIYSSDDRTFLSHLRSILYSSDRNDISLSAAYIETVSSRKK